jgi:hypothetical protein
MEVKYEHRLTEAEAHIADHGRRIKDMEKRQDDLEKLTNTVSVLAVKEENIEKTVTEIKDDVKTLTDKPAKRWDLFITACITALASGAIGFVLAHFGF